MHDFGRAWARLKNDASKYEINHVFEVTNYELGEDADPTDVVFEATDSQTADSGERV